MIKIKKRIKSILLTDNIIRSFPATAISSGRYNVVLPDAVLICIIIFDTDLKRYFNNDTAFGEYSNNGSLFGLKLAVNFTLPCVLFNLFFSCLNL